MKKNNIFKVVCCTILLAVILTWIIPAYGGDERVQIGLFDLFGYLSGLLSTFGYIPLFILAVGGFYGVLYKTDGYRNLLDNIVRKYTGSEWIFLTIIMVLFGVITSVTGLSMGLLFLFPFVITTILLMGYSKITALLVTVGSVCVGLIGTTYSIAEVGIINETLKLPASNELIAKIVILVIGLIILIVNTLVYAKKHRIDSPRKGFLYPESSNSSAKSWPIVIVFDIVLLIMILSFISWLNVFEITLFDDILNSINSYKIGDFPLFAKLLGYVGSFGNWQLTDLTTLILLATGFVAFICRVKFDDMIDGFGAGAKKALRPAFVSTLVYFLVFVSFNHQYTLNIVKPVLDLTDTFNVVTTSVAAFVSHFFNDYAGFYILGYVTPSSVLGYITTTFTDTSIYGVIAVIWQSIYGFAMLFVPTSAILVAGLSYLNVSYFRWLKAIWKLLLQLLLVLLIIFLILVMI